MVDLSYYKKGIPTFSDAMQQNEALNRQIRMQEEALSRKTQLEDEALRMKQAQFDQQQVMGSLKQQQLQQNIATGGGTDPSAVKIVNEMQKAAIDAQNPKLDPRARDIAKFRYEQLNQVAKSFAIDRGMTPAMPTFGQQPIQQQGLPIQQDAGQQLPLGQQPIQQTGVQEVPGFSEIQEQRKFRQKEAEVLGGKMGEAKDKYLSFKSQLPGLERSVNELYKLADVASYTHLGRFTDAFKRQAGVDVSSAAEARAKYDNLVKVTVLPTLKATLGGNFSIEEGKWLLSTLGNLDLTPAEKKSQIDARVQSWINMNETNALRIGVEPDKDLFKRGESEFKKRKEEVKKKSGVVDYKSKYGLE